MGVNDPAPDLDSETPAVAAPPRKGARPAAPVVSNVNAPAPDLDSEDETPAAKTAQSGAEPQHGYAMDIAKSAGSGVLKGGADIAGLPGAALQAEGWLEKKLGGEGHEYSPDENWIKVGGVWVPTMKGAEAGLQKYDPTGLSSYESQTLPGTLAGGATRFATGAALTGGLGEAAGAASAGVRGAQALTAAQRAAKVGQAIKTGAVSGVGSEGLGYIPEHLEGTPEWMKTAAHVAGAVAAPMGLKAVTGRGAAAASGANTFGKNVGSEVRGSASNLSQAEIDMAHSVGLEPTMYDIAGPKGRKAFDQAAANSPDARVVADKMASDMADRAANAKQIVGDHIEGLNGRPLDSASRQAAIEAQGDIQNSANYGAARAHPNAADMSHQGLHDLADNSPALRDAITKAEEAAKEVLPIDKATGLPDQSRKIIPRSAATPDTQVPSSIIGPDGKPVMKTIPGTPAVGGNLNFWHNVKMNLDNQIQNAVRSADKPVISQLMGVKERLLNQMDAAIPEYQTARNAAAETFGASNAIEAGHNSMGLAKKAFNVPDMNINYSSMTPEQKSLFREGMLGHMHDIATKDGPAGVAKLLNDPNVAKHVKNVLGEPVFNHIKNHSDILQKLIKTKAPASEGVLSPTVKHEAGKWGIGAGGIGEAIALMHGLPLTGLAAGAAGAMGRKGFELLKDAKIRREAKRIAPEAAMSHPATVRQYVHDAATKAPRGLASRAAGLPGKAAPYVTPAYQAGKTEEVNPEYQRGGAVSGHQHLVDRLFSEVEKARKAEKGRTSVLLRQPDEHIAKALNMAQAAI